MSIKTRDFDALIAKFGFEVRQTHHLHAWLAVDGKIAVRTRRSNVRGDLPAAHLIRRQMHLNSREFDNAIRCTLSLDDYVQLLRDKSVI